MLPSHRVTVLFSQTIMSFAILSSNLSYNYVSTHVFFARTPNTPSLKECWEVNLPEVVRNDHDTAVESHDGVSQTINRRDIETVGGFVQ